LKHHSRFGDVPESISQTIYEQPNDSEGDPGIFFYQANEYVLSQCEHVSVGHSANRRAPRLIDEQCHFAENLMFAEPRHDRLSLLAVQHDLDFSAQNDKRAIAGITLAEDDLTHVKRYWLARERQQLESAAVDPAKKRNSRQ